MGNYGIDPAKGIVEQGSARMKENIAKLMRRMAAGEPVTMGFLGGSITQGAAATTDELCYAYRVYSWFGAHFPKSDITYVNAGIGATDSEYAAARVSEDILSSHPDFVLMEFSVNDGCNDHFMEAYEGAVRQILKSRPDMAMMLMSNVFYNEGQSSERIHRAVARHYGLPLVSMRPTIYDAILRGDLVKEQITADDLHPNDEGHELVAQIICAYPESVLKSMQEDPGSYGTSADHEADATPLPEPLTPNRYERSVKYDNRNSAQVIRSIQGFVPDETPRSEVRDCFRYGYSSMEKGAHIEYEVEGCCIAIQYRRTISKPAPVALVTIDDDESLRTVLDANFEETWGDMLTLTDVYMSDESATHTVRIEITDISPDMRGDFYLAGIIVSG